MAVFAHQQFLLSGTLQTGREMVTKKCNRFLKFTEEYTPCMDKEDKQTYLEEPKCERKLFNELFK